MLINEFSNKYNIWKYKDWFNFDHTQEISESAFYFILAAQQASIYSLHKEQKDDNNDSFYKFHAFSHI